MVSIEKLKEQVIADKTYAPNERKFVAYIDSINRKDKNGKDLTFNMSEVMLGKIFNRYNNAGIIIDGTNAVITGYNRVFITWIGYKNKVLSVYPESEFDTQLVRADDTFNFAKESGAVVYTHNIASPFASNKDIIGSYCVIKNKRGEFLETLGKDDFDKMKAQSDLSRNWTKWESEFWLKSVIKRACKRHFNDIVIEIETIDNQDYTLEDVGATDEKKKAILEAHDNNS